MKRLITTAVVAGGLAFALAPGRAAVAGHWPLPFASAAAPPPPTLL